MTQWSNTLAAAALGTGTAETNLSTTYKVPSAARELVAYMPFVYTTAPAAAESVVVVVGIRGSDYKKQPMEVFAPIGGAHLGTIGGNNLRDPRWHEVHSPLTGNETFTIYAEALDAMAGNAKVGVIFLYNDKYSGLPTIKSVCTRETAVQTIGTNGTNTLSINGANHIHEIEGVATTSTVTADEPWDVGISLNSTGFESINDVDFTAYSDTIEATSGIQTAYPIRVPVDLNVTSNAITINITYAPRLTLSAAGQAGICVKYT